MPLFYNISAEDPDRIKILDNPTKTLKALAFPIECLSEFSTIQARILVTLVMRGIA